MYLPLCNTIVTNVILRLVAKDGCPPFGSSPRIEPLVEAIRWNYTSVLNILFLALVALLLVRFFRTGGPEMLRMIDSAAVESHGHSHAHHDHSNDQHSHHHQM